MGRTSKRDAYVYVPYGQDKLAKGDGVYCVAVEEGELWLLRPGNRCPNG